MESGEAWQWSRSMDGAAFTIIAQATSDNYTPVDMDDGYYLRATVMYTDGHGFRQGCDGDVSQQSDPWAELGCPASITPRAMRTP